MKLPLGILTASAALYNKEHFELPLPRPNPVTTGRVLLVWGGSSNVGVAAIQLAAASGVEVVPVASDRNWDLVRQAGAETIFDHNNPDIVGHLVEYMRGRNLIGIFDGKTTPSPFG